jgi:hypothetical protein
MTDIFTPDEFAYELANLWSTDDESADRVTRHDQALRDALRTAETERDAWHQRWLTAQDDLDNATGTVREVVRLRAALERTRRPHYYCEDCWYSCPKAEDGCCDDSRGDDCTCGADAFNAEIDAVLGRVVETTPESEPPIPADQICPTCGSTNRAVSVRGKLGATLRPFVCDDAWHDGETER